MAKDKPLENSARFFLFHSDSVTEDIARGDLLFCIKMARPTLSYRAKLGGGGILGGLLADTDTLRMRNSVMRKCMTLHGYSRYLVPETQWNGVVKEGDIVVGNDGKVDAEVVNNMAAFAAGPKPNFPLLEP